MSSLLRRSLSAAAVTLFAGASMTMLAGTASAAATLIISPVPVQQGQLVAVGGTECYDPADPANIGTAIVTIDGEVSTAEVAADGTWGGTLQTSTDDAVGTYPVTATCDYYTGSFEYPAGAITVVAPSAPALSVVPKEVLQADMQHPAKGALITATSLAQASDVTIALTMPDGSVATLDPDVTDDAGTVVFNVYYVGGPAPLGKYTVTVTDANGTSVSGTFTVVTALTPPIVLKYSKVFQGGSDNVKAAGFTPGETVEVWINSDPVRVASVIADADGKINVDFVVPLSVSVGSHTVVVKGLASGYTVSAPLEVLAATKVDGKGPNLAATGFDATSTLGLGALLLVLGAGAVAYGRRSSTTSV